MPDYTLTITVTDLVAAQNGAQPVQQTAGIFRTLREATTAMEAAAHRLWESYGESLAPNTPTGPLYGCWINGARKATVRLPITVTHFAIVKS